MQEICECMKESSIYSQETGDFSLHQAEFLRFTNIRLLRESKLSMLYTADLFDRKIALKALRQQAGRDTHNRIALRREFQLLQSLNSPYIISAWQLIDVPDIGECIAMEYVDGIDLRQWLTTSPGWSARRRVLDELLEAVSYLHLKQLVHADLKPENILITHNGHHVKLIDFGLSDQDSMLAHNIGYTPEWAAPEQLSMSAIDCRADIFTLGKLIQLIFPHRYQWVTRKCLQQDKNKRYASIDQLRKGLASYRQLIWLVLTILVAGIGIMLLRPKPFSPLPVRKSAVIAPVYDENGTLRAYSEPNFNRENYWEDETTPIPGMLRKASHMLDKTIADYQDSLAAMPYPYKEFAILCISSAQDRFAQEFTESFLPLRIQYEPERNECYSHCHKRLYDALQKDIAPYTLFHEEYARGTISDSLFRVLITTLDNEYMNKSHK